ncbi:hypothetical protein D1007_58322 [Hordeum vulgare]|nr:hypothetical protein D1007_58322 [Hordeum vulgare]
MEGARRAVAITDLEVPKQQEDTDATAVAAAELEKEVPVTKQEDTTATAVAAADLEKDVPKQEDTTSRGAADDEEKEAACMKRRLAKTGFKSPYESDYDDNDPYEYNCGDDVEDSNKESFIEKEAHKIREKGKATYFKRGMFRCPYCTTKPKPRDGIYEHLMSHARGLSRSAEDIKTRAEHAALMKALGCCELCYTFDVVNYVILLMLWQDVMDASILLH